MLKLKEIHQLKKNSESLEVAPLVQGEPVLRIPPAAGTEPRLGIFPSYSPEKDEHNEYPLSENPPQYPSFHPMPHRPSPPRLRLVRPRSSILKPLYGEPSTPSREMLPNFPTQLYIHEFPSG